MSSIYSVKIGTVFGLSRNFGGADRGGTNKIWRKFGALPCGGGVGGRGGGGSFAYDMWWWERGMLSAVRWRWSKVVGETLVVGDGGVEGFCQRWLERGCQWWGEREVVNSGGEREVVSCGGVEDVSEGGVERGCLHGKERLSLWSVSGGEERQKRGGRWHGETVTLVQLNQSRICSQNASNWPLIIFCDVTGKQEKES